jgi:hypothetical protein
MSGRPRRPREPSYGLTTWNRLSDEDKRKAHPSTIAFYTYADLLSELGLIPDGPWPRHRFADERALVEFIARLEL